MILDTEQVRDLSAPTEERATEKSGYSQHKLDPAQIQTSEWTPQTAFLLCKKTQKTSSGSLIALRCVCGCNQGTSCYVSHS